MVNIMTKVVFVFHDSCIYSGATASMIELIEGMSFGPGYSVMAVLPNVGDSTLLKNRLNNQNIETESHSIYMTRCQYKGSMVKKLLSFSYAGISIFRCYFEAKKAAAIIGNADIVYTNTSSTYFGMFLSKKPKLEAYNTCSRVWH